MRNNYNIIKNWLLNGVFSYVIFGIYALTISPFITNFIDFLKPNKFVGILGFVMLFAEYFALNFKLKMIRFRTEEKRIAYKKETGKDILPSSPSSVLFGFFMRLIFHIIIVMVSMTALGYDCGERNASPQGVIAMLSVFALDMAALIHMYFAGDFYTDPFLTKKEFREEIKEGDDWYAANKEKVGSVKYYRLEIVSDVVLQIYALILFTAVWRKINELGFEILHNSLLNHLNAFWAGILIVNVLMIIVIMSLMPMRIAYWIEDSMAAFTRKEKRSMWITFFIVALFCCSPSLIQYIKLFILHLPEIKNEQIPWYVGYIISFLLFVILLTIQILFFRKNGEKPTEITP